MGHPSVNYTDSETTETEAPTAMASRGVEESNSTSFDDKRAELTREQWADFQTRYLPVQNDLLDLASNDVLLTEQLERNKGNINNSFSLAEQGESMRMSRYGLSSEDSKQSKANTGLLKSLTTASVNNSSRSSAEELQNKIITGQGGAPSTLADIGNQ